MANKQSGVAIVEFALVLPFMLMLVFMTTELGRAVYQYNTITKSVRDAVRYMSVQTPGTHTLEAQNLVVYGNPAGTGAPLARGLGLGNVPAPTWQTAGSGPLINTVRVKVSGYTFQPLLGSVFGLALNNIVYSDISATMRCSI